MFKIQRQLSLSSQSFPLPMKIPALPGCLLQQHVIGLVCLSLKVRYLPWSALCWDGIDDFHQFLSPLEFGYELRITG